MLKEKRDSRATVPLLVRVDEPSRGLFSPRRIPLSALMGTRGTIDSEITPFRAAIFPIFPHIPPILPDIPPVLLQVPLIRPSIPAVLLQVAPITSEILLVLPYVLAILLELSGTGSCAFILLELTPILPEVLFISLNIPPIPLHVPSVLAQIASVLPHIAAILPQVSTILPDILPIVRDIAPQGSRLRHHERAGESCNQEDGCPHCRLVCLHAVLLRSGELPIPPFSNNAETRFSLTRFILSETGLPSSQC